MAMEEAVTPSENDEFGQMESDQELMEHLRPLLANYSLQWDALNSKQTAQLHSVAGKINCDPQDSECAWRGYKCYIESWLKDISLVPGTASPVTSTSENCPVSFDGHVCWSPQLPSRRSLLPCPIPAGYYQHCQALIPNIDVRSLRAFRDCGSDGKWIHDESSYSACVQYVNHCLNLSDSTQGPRVSNRTVIPELLDDETKRIVTYVFAGLAITSLILLSVSFFIFCYFKTLYCSRNSIHKNLIAALMLHVISLLVILSPRISGDETIHREAWLCKSFMFLSMYAVPASIMWTFVEGLYLSQRLALAVFKKEAPFKLYYFIGWGIPLVLVTVWALVTEFHPAAETDLPVDEAGDPILDTGPAHAYRSNTCWQQYSKQGFYWIIIGPCLAALTVNLIFLVLIIIILVTKLRANNAVETVQVRKAIKATLILVPLLGISNLLFFANPNDNGVGERAYIIANLILKGSQGIFVALIYCFLNSEVQMAVQKKCYRAALRRNPETQSFRFGSLRNGTNGTDITNANRRKSSTRTASTTLVSSTEMQKIHSLAAKRQSLIPLRSRPLPLVNSRSHHVRFKTLPTYAPTRSDCDSHSHSREHEDGCENAMEDCYV